MKNKRILILAAVSVAILFSIARFLQHSEIPTETSGKEVYYALRVIDGDTIELLNGERLRYIGIDTPEMYKRDGSEWIYSPMPYAEEARDFNREFIEGKKVRLEFDVQKRDGYDRLLAYVYTGDKMVNLEMVREGYSMIYRYPPNERYIEEFLNAQEDARKNKRGLWSSWGEDVLSTALAKENIGLIRMIEAKVLDTFISEGALILNCRDNFKVVIFKNNLTHFPKIVLRSPESYFKRKTIRVYGVIEDYKGASEIVVNMPAQLEIME